MSTARLPRVLLGPQRPTRNLGDAVNAVGLADGPLAVISAGWQEAENDIDDVRALVDRSLEDLCLYRRAEAFFATDADGAAAYRARQDRLIEQQRLYRLRLKPLAQAARNVLRGDGDADMLAAEQRHAISQLRALDRHHLHRTEAIRRDFDERYNAIANEQLRHNAEEIRALLERVAGVIITGGNVAVLLNRMRLFGVDELIAGLPIIAWSAGAMVLAERVVLFHDRTPQGRRDPELLGTGCCLVSGYVVLPDTASRLRERDKLRIETMSRRFSPDSCIALDSGALLHLDGGTIVGAESARHLNRNGRLVRVRPR